MDLATDLLAGSDRSKVLRAMAHLWASRGYEEMSLEQVASRGEVEPTALGTLFADKEETATAAVDAILAEVVATVSANYSADRPEWDSYLLAIKGLLELMAAHPSFAYVVYIGSRQAGPPAVSKAHEAGIRVLLVLLDRLWEYSGSELQPSCASRGALGGAEAVVRREIMAGRVEQLPRLLPDFAYGATVPFLGQEKALRLARRGEELLEGRG